MARILLTAAICSVTSGGHAQSSSDSDVQPGAETKKPNFFQRLLKRTPPRFKGSIDFSEPQEYSRERLISEWLNEYDVYSTVLGTYTTLNSTAHISGAVDQRIFDLLAGKVTASFDPLKGRLDKAGQGWRGCGGGPYQQSKRTERAVCATAKGAASRADRSDAPGAADSEHQNGK